MKAAGCIVVGKTNMPEFGLGSHTFNPLFGATPNAWDAAVSAGGSSGGAAVALALRLLPVADGSDFMGSLRNPAAWAHVFGCAQPGPRAGLARPTPGSASWAPKARWAARVRDVALLLQTQAGADPRTPLSIADGRSTSCRRPTPRPARPARGLAGRPGRPPGDGRRHAGGVRSRRWPAWPRHGAIVEPTALGFDADALWQRLAGVAPRAGGPKRGSGAGKQPGATRAQIKPEALWEHDQATA
jgi:amidase